MFFIYVKTVRGLRSTSFYDAQFYDKSVLNRYMFVAEKYIPIQAFYTCIRKKYVRGWSV